MPAPPPVCIALLRAVNVGGRARVPMADLRAALARRGFSDVRTYVQSGNVVLRPPLGTTCDAVARLVEAAVLEASGVATMAIVRTADELAAIVAACPFPAPEAAGTHHHVAFLAGPPTPEAAARLDPQRSPPDALVLHDREVYLHLPGGAGRTRITAAWIERVLGTAVTARNWNTVLALHRLGQDGEQPTR